MLEVSQELILGLGLVSDFALPVLEIRMTSAGLLVVDEKFCPRRRRDRLRFENA
jgi:hypothetical protein